MDNIDPQTTSTPPVPTTPVFENTTKEIANPLLSRVRMPGETFRLPSGGIFYRNGELRDNVKDGEVHVLPMTAIDEIVMKSPDMLYSGDAINDVFSRCIPDVLRPDDLLAKDVDFLLICLRKVSYGHEMEITATHTCEDAKEHSYVISMDQFIKDSKRIDPTTIASSYTAEMPNGQIVKLQPIGYKNFVKLMQVNDSEYATPEKIKNVSFDALLDVIISVDEITNKTMISEWLDKLPAGWLRVINTKIEDATNWGPTFTTQVKCKDCSATMEVTAPLNAVAFFT